MGLTKSSLLGLLYCKGDGREQFNQDLHDELGHRRGGWNLCKDVEAPEKGFERLKKFNERVVALANIFDCLMEVSEQSSRLGLGETHTPRSTKIPANIAFTGGKGWKKSTTLSQRELEGADTY